MSDPRERYIDVNGHACRVWEKGSIDAEPIWFLAGLFGLPRWTSFLDHLSATRRVIAPSLPGFPGADGHLSLDTTLDWITAALDLLEGSGMESGDLVASSVGGALATEVAALSAGSVRRLALLAPFGLFDEREPVADVWAQAPGSVPGLVARDAGAITAFLARPGDADPIEWEIQSVRASEAAARLLWPLGDLSVHKRLHRIRVPTLVLWGSADRVVPASYAKRYADEISGPVVVRSIDGAGHLLDVDAPIEAAEIVRGFLR